ncbi:serine/threonine-protein kinase [Tunturiibacter lichenicola]|uniref:serine/threonine-protein kinase n=1 Tax=Tunturiibacter lichenicola TaxID=2051959 RepID=UPI0021B4260F|nr:serine/threonine-protein kinase [Edaphobacter lichenicola]
MFDTKDSLSVGELIENNYEILGVVGAGGMGIVYRSRDLKLQRIVALKFLPTSLNDDREREYFLSEARMASSLDHPNIGVIHGIEETSDGRAFIVMAFYDGLSLAQKMNAAPLTTLEAIEIAGQIALGLCEAHAHQIVHRDIKPSNVMLSGTGSIKIVDFGLARAVNAETATVTGIVGTVKYVSPEQALGQRIDPRTDIWSLGVVLAEMLTGVNPFERKTIPAILIAILHEPPQSLDGLPVELQRIIYCALSKNPEKRYQHCSEMLLDLQRVHAEMSAASASNRAVSARRTAGRSSEMRRYIEEASTPQWGKPKRSRSQWLPWVILLSGLVLVVCLLAYSSSRHYFSMLHFGPREKHIAVLPFNDLGGRVDSEALGQGLMDSLAGKLSNLDLGHKSLWVIPTSEVLRLKVTDPAAALKLLNANLVVSGVVRHDGKAVDLSLNLIDTRDLRLIGSVNVEDQGGDLAMLQNEAVSRLAHLMTINVTAAMLHDTEGALEPAAYEDYLAALGYMQRYDKSGNLDKAIDVLNASLKTDPRFALGYAQLGEAYRVKYQVDHDPHLLDEAQANLEQATRIDSHIPAVYVSLGRIHDAQGKRDLALQEFQHALDLDQRNALALRGLARVYQHSGRNADAETTFKQAIALQPNDWEGYNLLGNFYSEQGRYPESISEYKRAIDLTPDNAEAYLNLGATYIDAGSPQDLSSAEEPLKKSIQLSPSYAAYANLGSLYIQQHRHAESVAATEKALQLNGKDYMVWNNLLVEFEWLHDQAGVERAKKRLVPLLEQTVQLRPQDAIAQAVLAVMQAKNKDRQQAVDHIQTAVALEPEDPMVLQNAADVYEMEGDRKRALGYLEQALQKGLDLNRAKNDPDSQALFLDPNFHPAKPKS